jgi:hypothetical protein
MRTSFHRQPEAQTQSLDLSTTTPADYPIFGGKVHDYLIPIKRKASST